MTLQQTIERLAIFTEQEDPDQCVPTLQLAEAGGATLTLHYTGSGVTDVPREAQLVYSAADELVFAFVYEPTRYMAAIDEGLSPELAEVEARRIVLTLDNVLLYLRGQAYRLA
jgi:hypothetical protein